MNPRTRPLAEGRESLGSMLVGLLALVILAGVFAVIVLGYLSGLAAPLTDLGGLP